MRILYGNGSREEGLADGSERFPFVQPSFFQCFPESLDALHTVTNNLSFPLPLYPHLYLILLQTLSHCTQKLTSLDSRKRTQPSSRTRPTN